MKNAENSPDSIRPSHPGAVQAKEDFSEFSTLLDALASSPQTPFPSVAARVLETIRAEQRRARNFRAWLCASLSGAAALLFCVFLPSAPEPVPTPAFSGTESVAEVLPPVDRALQTLLSGQAEDGSWMSRNAAESMRPAATGLAMLRLLEAPPHPAIDAALQKAVQWLRAHQTARGTFGGDEAKPYNLSFPTLALLRLYETGAYPDLFTPVDGAVQAVRRRLSGVQVQPAADELYLASALALADSCGWSDSLSGGLRHALRRMEASADPRFREVASARGYSGKCLALLRVSVPRR